MKPDENIEKFVKDAKPQVTTGSPMDKRTLDDSFAAMEKTIQGRTDIHRKNLPIVILRSRAVQLAAAAVIVITAVSIFLERGGHTPVGPAAGPRSTAESPAKIVSMMSLRTAYRQGGMDALDEQLRDTLNVLGPPSLNVSRWR
jgi:hypothetical protein